MYDLLVDISSVWKVSKYEVFPGSYFPVYEVNILRKSPYSVWTWESTGQEKLRIWTLFTQRRHQRFKFTTRKNWSKYIYLQTCSEVLEYFRKLIWKILLMEFSSSKFCRSLGFPVSFVWLTGTAISQNSYPTTTSTESNRCNR